MAETIAYASGLAADAGIRGEPNEDAAYAGRRLFAVADGFGSIGLGGEVASAAVIDTLIGLDTEAPPDDPVAALEGRAGAAAERVRRLCDEHSSLAGATLTAMLWSGRDAALAHIGNSRAYLLRDQVLFQITKDHTIARLRVEAGEMTGEEAATSKDRSLLTACFAGRTEHLAEMSAREGRVGDRYLLCTDGLLVLDARNIHHVLGVVEDPRRAAARLVEEVTAAGGPDNVACVVVDVRAATPAAGPGAG